MSKQIIRIDASSMKHSICLLAFYRMVVLGWRRPLNNNDTEFGTAIHLFIKIMYETGGDFAEATRRTITYFREKKMIVKDKKRYLDDHHLLKTCFEYWNSYLLKDSTFEVLKNSAGQPAVEVTFSNKFYEDDNYIIYLEGTIDKIGKFKNGPYAIGDYKSTSSWEHEKYFEEYELKTQLRFYHFNVHLAARLNPDSVLTEITRLPVGVFIDAIFLNGATKTEFKRSRVFMFKKEAMDRYEMMLTNFIVNEFIPMLKHCEHNQCVPEPTGMLNDACTANFGCPYQSLCSAPDDIASGLIFKRDFITKQYEPLTHGKES